MQKPIIGIICQPNGFDNEEIFKNRYYILDNYVQAITNNNGIPIGILMNNLETIEDNLKLCDGFLITGGIRVCDYHLKVIDYAIKNNKPFLGICMGMQALAMYSLKSSNEKNTLSLITKPHNHYDSNNDIHNKNKTIHKVNIINKKSHIYKVLKNDIIDVNSYHNYHVTKLGNDFEVCGYSEDGLIEVIEHKDKNKFILGVQWHPELLESMTPLIKEFIKKSGSLNETKCRKNKY